MATVKELQRRTNRIIDDDFDNIDLIDWFNQCQNEALSDIIYIPSSQILSLVDGVFLLPENYKDLLEIVTDEPLEYEIYGGEITVDNEDLNNLKIRYNRKPKMIINNPDQVPDIPSEFHNVYVFYGAMMAMLSDEEHTRYKYFEREFQKVSFRLKRHMDKKKRSVTNTTQWKVVR